MMGININGIGQIATLLVGQENAVFVAREKVELETKAEMFNQMAYRLL